MAETTTGQAMSANKRNPNLVARDYQLELLHKAKSKNVIICLGTGTGKTFISLKLIEELFQETRLSLPDGGRRSVFLAPTVPLVIQQGEGLRRWFGKDAVNTYSGSKVDQWEKEKWIAEFDRYNVLVMTPQIFSDILNRTDIHLSNINLLVMDECHSATGNSPYVQIMQNHYQKLATSRRPKILGLTASALNGKVKPIQIKKELRNLCSRLNANFVTSLNAANYGTKPVEALVCYETLSSVDITIPDPVEEVPDPKSSSMKGPGGQDKLRSQIEQLLVDVGPFGTLMATKYRIHITEHLVATSLAGEDKVAEYSELLNELRQIEASIEEWSRDVRLGSKQNRYPVQTPLDEVHKAIDKPEKYSFPPKVYRLIEMFDIFNRVDQTLCCVVFALQRSTVFALWCTLKMLSRRCKSRYGYLRPGFIMGQGSMPQFSSLYTKVMSFADERLPENSDKNVLTDFREGLINVLVATSVIEEGVDIRKCNLVVRFTEPTNLRSYVQGRGRARAKPSIYAIMCPADGADKASDRLRDFKEAELQVLKYCLQGDIDIDSADVEEALRGDPDLPPFYARPEAKDDSPIITAQGARSILQCYCDTLGSDRFKVLRPIFNIEVVPRDIGPNWYKCSIEFPKESKLHPETVYGNTLETRVKAKISAALEACRRLYQLDELTERLLPRKRPKADIYIWTDEEVSDNVKVLFEGNIVSQKAQICCDRSQARELLPRRIPCLPARAKIFAFRISMDEPPIDENDHKRIFQAEDEPLCFGVLTFTDDINCEIPSFPIFTKAGREMVRVEQLHNVLVTAQDWKLCNEFHRYMITRVLKVPDVKCDPTLAPVIVPISNNSLDSAVLDRIGSATEPTLNSDSVVTFWEGTARISCFVGQLFESDGSLRVSLMSIPKNLDFITNRFTVKSQSREKTSDEMKRDFARSSDGLSVEPLTASQWSKSLSVASCCYRLNRFLVAEELRVKLHCPGTQMGHQTASLTAARLPKDLPTVGRDEDIILDGINFICDASSDSTGPTAVDIYTALSPRSTEDIVDSELYEVIGDSFLKLVVSMDLFDRFGSEDEGDLTRQRSRLVSNIHLVSLAEPLNIHNAVESVKFSPRVNFLPPGCLADDEQQPKFVRQKYKSKVCADSVEALIGVYLEKAGTNGALDFLIRLGLELKCKKSGPFISRFNLCEITSPSDTDTELVPLQRHVDTLRGVESIIEYEFTDKRLLLEAITHQSYRYRGAMNSYERLEFLGDAVIDYLVSRLIYYNCPQITPGKLTDTRSALVSNATFARAIASHGLYRHLLHESPLLHKVADAYLASLQSGLRDEVLVCEDETEVTDDISGVDVPKPFADLLESLMGAVFLDSGMNFDRVWLTFRKLIGDSILKEYIINVPRSPVVKLMEMFPGKVKYEKAEILKESDLVRVKLTVGEDEFEVIARNKKTARIALAKKAIRHFERIQKSQGDLLGPMESIAKELEL